MEIAKKFGVMPLTETAFQCVQMFWGFFLVFFGFVFVCLFVCFAGAVKTL